MENFGSPLLYGLHAATVVCIGGGRVDGDEALACQLLRWALLHRFGSLERWLAIAGVPVPTDLRELAVRVCGLHADSQVRNSIP